MWENVEKSFGNQEFLGQPAYQLFLIGGATLLILLLRKPLAKLLLYVFYKIFKKYTPEVEATDFIKAIKKPVELLVLIICLRFVLAWLSWPVAWHINPVLQLKLEKIIDGIFDLGIIWLSIKIALLINNFFFNNYIFYAKQKSENSANSSQIAPFLRETLRFALIILGFLVLLAWVFHVNVAAMLAGLGIGGLAVALAGKETLENLFASFTIFLDKPFVVGDFVQSGQLSGTVEQVGFRSTRLRSLDKTYITLPNKIMVDQPLNNMSRRASQPTRIRLCLPFDLEIDVLETVIDTLRQTLTNKEPSISPDHHVFIKEMRDQGIDLQLHWHVQSMDFTIYNQTNHDIFFQILKTLRTHNCPVWIPSEWKKIVPNLEETKI